MSLIFPLEVTKNEDDECLVVVRLRTYAWRDKRGFYLKKDLSIQKRLSKGYNFFEEDCANVGDLDILSKIINLHKVDDGLYKITTCNQTTDWETGYVDDYDYELIPYKTNDKASSSSSSES